MNVDLGQKNCPTSPPIVRSTPGKGKMRMQNEQNCPYLGIRSDVMMMMMIKEGCMIMMMIKGGGVYNNDDDDKDNDVWGSGSLFKKDHG